MNEKIMDPRREEDLARKLNQAAEQTSVNSQFAAELEARLRSKYPARPGRFIASFRQVSPALRWIAFMILLGLVLSLSIRTLIPAPQPAANGTPIAIPTQTLQTPFEYTVKPGDTCAGIAMSFDVSVQSIITLNNLSSDCIVAVGQTLKIPYPTPTPALPSTDTPNKTPIPDGKSFDYDGGKLILNVALPSSPAQAKLYAWHAAQPATVEYARTLADQFGIVGEVYTTQGRFADKSAFMVTDGKQQLTVYADNDYTYISDLVKNARNPSGFKNENAETIIAEYLKAHGLDFHYRFVADQPSAYFLEQLAPDDRPMQSAYSGGAYMTVTLDEDGNVLDLTALLMNYDPASLGDYQIISAEEALNRLLDPNLPAGKIEMGSGPASPFIDYTPPTYWFHDYPDDQTVTIYGQVIANPAVDKTKPAVIFIDNVPATGNVSGMDRLNDFAFAQATGQFTVENGIRRFNVDTWEQIEQANFMGSAHREGDQIILEDQSGSKNILADPPADLPLDTVSPETIYCQGAVVDGTFYWISIQYIKDVNSMGGGGGGGGMGFYKLNLSGTPVPFPTSTPGGNAYSYAEAASFLRHTVGPNDTLAQIAQTYNVSEADLMAINHMTDSTVTTGTQLIIPGVPGPTRLDGERGIVQVQYFAKPDGRQRTQYTFTSEKDPTSYEVLGDNLEPLQKAANRPIKIWGSLSIDQAGRTFLHFEKFEALYPDLQFQVLNGTQETKEINGVQVSLFMSGGTTYVELAMSGGSPNSNTVEQNGPVSLEVLEVPGETYAGYPALRVFMQGYTVDPKTGEAYALTPIAGTPEVMPDPFGNADAYTPPDIIVEKVELMYLLEDTYLMNGETAPTQTEYDLQPVWLFHGSTSDGGTSDILIQALAQEYLLPQTGP